MKNICLLVNIFSFAQFFTSFKFFCFQLQAKSFKFQMKPRLNGLTIVLHCLVWAKHKGGKPPTKWIIIIWQTMLFADGQNADYLTSNGGINCIYSNLLSCKGARGHLIA
jgi:hypothetical protein